MISDLGQALNKPELQNIMTEGEQRYTCLPFFLTLLPTPTFQCLTP